MQMLIVVLNKVEMLDDLLFEWNKAGIRGGTIIDSMGMVRALLDEHLDIPLFGSLKSVLNEDRPINKTIFMVLKDDRVELAMECVRKTIGNIDEENTGIMFTMPIDQVEGLTK